MTLDEEECWARLAGERHGVLATVHPRRGVDAVPVVFVVLPGGAGTGGLGPAGSGGAARRSIVIPVDTVKPKRSGGLQRLANIEGEPGPGLVAVTPPGAGPPSGLRTAPPSW